jgi:hypothetical protein
MLDPFYIIKITDNEVNACTYAIQNITPWLALDYGRRLSSAAPQTSLYIDLNSH